MSKKSALERWLVNNVGQVLIKSVVENENGKSIHRPIIWENGKITKLKGLEGDLVNISKENVFLGALIADHRGGIVLLIEL